MEQPTCYDQGVTPTSVSEIKDIKKKKEKEYVSLIESDLPLFSLSFHQIYILYYTQLHVRAQIDSIRILYGATFISG